jgi:heme/copper-type cytochrome/quinol oxidase subunit 4
MWCPHNVILHLKWRRLGWAMYILLTVIPAALAAAGGWPSARLVLFDSNAAVAAIDPSS